MNFLIVLLLSCVVLGLSETPDYCSAKYKEQCGDTTHVGCKATSELGSHCPKDAVLYKADDIKDDLTYFHNYYRNKIALGEVPSYDPAKKMATVEWDDVLADLAVINIKTCRFEHDRCRSTAIFKQAGQNLAGQGLWSKGPIPDIKELSNKTVEMWFNEYKDGDGRTDMKNLTLDRMMKFGHFTQMTVDRLTRVGCGMIKFINPDDTDFINVNVACNYGPTHMYNVPLYEAGKPASECQTGPNPEFPGLCSTAEIFEPNWW